MDRLTDLIVGEENEYCTYIANQIQVLNKLGKLEDILEKYGIESAEELAQELELNEATKESLYASRELYEKEKTKCWGLQQQLKEKDEEIEALKYLSGCPNDINEMVRKVVYRDEQLIKQYDFFQKEIEQLKQSQNQKAKEVLEKIREFILNERKENMYNFSDYNKGKNNSYYEIKELLDQIEKELEEV